MTRTDADGQAPPGSFGSAGPDNLFIGTNMRIERTDWHNEVIWERALPETDEEFVRRLTEILGGEPQTGLVVLGGQRMLGATEYVKESTKLAARAGRTGIIKAVVDAGALTDKQWAQCWEFVRFQASGLMAMAAAGAPVGLKSSQPLLWAALADQTGAAARQLMAAGHDPADPRYWDWHSAGLVVAPLLLELGFEAPEMSASWLSLISQYAGTHGELPALFDYVPALDEADSVNLLRSVAVSTDGEIAPERLRQLADWLAERVSPDVFATALIWAATVPLKAVPVLEQCAVAHLKDKGAFPLVAHTGEADKIQLSEAAFWGKLLQTLVSGNENNAKPWQAHWQTDDVRPTIERMLACLTEAERAALALQAVENGKWQSARFWLDRSRFDAGLLLFSLASLAQKEPDWRGSGAVSWRQSSLGCMAELYHWLARVEPRAIPLMETAWQGGNDVALGEIIHDRQFRPGYETLQRILRSVTASLSVVPSAEIAGAIRASRDLVLLARYSDVAMSVLPHLPEALRPHLMDNALGA